MATLATRLSNTGTFLVNGSFDEITTSTNRITTNTVYASLLDEVTFNRITPSIKNLLGYSQDLTQSVYWSAGNGVTFATSTVLGPDNSTYATLATITTTSNATRQSVTVTPNTQYTFSFFALRGTASNLVYSIYDITNSANISAGVSYYGQTSASLWNRIVVPFTTPAGCVSVGVYPERDNGALGTVYLWGAQLELGSTATIYQGTTLPNTIIPISASSRVASPGDTYVTTQFDEFTGAPIVDASLVQWVDAAQTASYPGSGTTWTNLNGSGSFSLSSSTFTTADGGAIVWPNSPAQGSFTPQPNITGAHTISIWVKPTVVDASTIKRYITLGSDSVVLRNDGVNSSGQIHYYLTVNSVITSLRVNSQVVANQTANFVATWNGSTMILYKNGVSIGSHALSGTLQTTTNWDAISGTTEPFVGNMYQIQMYTRALSADEVLQNFNALRRRYGL